MKPHTLEPSPFHTCPDCGALFQTTRPCTCPPH